MTSIQHTLLSSIRTTGIGLHGGERVSIQLLPAPTDHGVRFVRTDLPGHPTIQADARLVGETTLCTGLREGQAQVRTVEHLVSALAGLGVDNVLVEIDQDEVPILDGSAAPWVFLLNEAGLEAQGAPRREVIIKEPMIVQEGDKWVRLDPAPEGGFHVDFTVAFSHPAVPPSQSRYRATVTPEVYASEIAKARTFGFLEDVEMLREKRLALGGSLDNAVVLDPYRILNHHGLREEDEFARHKALDAIGDLALIGRPLVARYSAYKGGHAMNNQLARKVLASLESEALQARG